MSTTDCHNDPLSAGFDFDSDFEDLGVVRIYGPGTELFQQGTPADEISDS